MTPRSRWLALILASLALAACEHSAPGSVQAPADVGPISAGLPRRLTFHPLNDRTPSVSGGVLVYARQGDAYANTGYAPTGREECLAFLPVEGGTIKRLFCPHSLVSPADTFVHRWFEPALSPDGRSFVHVEIHDGLSDLVVRPLPPAGRGRASAGGTGGAAEGEGVASVISPFDGMWLAVDWLPDSSAVLAVGRSDRAPDDLWLLPLSRATTNGARPRQLTNSLPAVVAIDQFVAGTRIAFEARDGLRVEGTLYLPSGATGEDAVRVPCVLHSHGGPTHQSFRDWMPFRQLVVEAGMAFLSVDFRGSSGYGRAFRWANRGEWGHADAFDVIDAARWAAAQPWCDGRLAHYGASYGGYMTLCVLTEEPSLWKAGIDLYGDSEIAESYRHGDRPGRIDIERMMGRPDDPASAPAYRRGSPLYRIERIEAPLLIMHGRKDKRVSPLMTEKAVEALEIESKHYEVHWYDEEPHGVQKRENRRDAWKRSLDFLRRHLLEQADEDGGS